MKKFLKFGALIAVAVGLYAVYSLPKARATPVPEKFTMAIAGATITTPDTISIGAYRAHMVWEFGTVSGTYTTCTVQAVTTYDGNRFLKLGAATPVTVSTGQYNVWSIYGQAPDTIVTTTAIQTGTDPTALTTTGFGQNTRYIFACSGAYGTSAPVTISTIYK